MICAPCIQEKVKEKQEEERKQNRNEERKEKQNQEHKSNKNEANMRSGRRLSPEDKIAVCWYDQSDEMSS